MKSDAAGIVNQYEQLMRDERAGCILNTKPMNTTTYSTRFRLGKVIKATLGVEDHHLTPEAELKDDLGADSLDMAELAWAIDREFGSDLPIHEFEKIETVGELIAYVENKVGT